MTTSRSRVPFRSRRQAVFFCADRACRLTESSTSATRSSSTTSNLRGRSRLKGTTLWVTPDAVVAHEAHSSTRRLGTTGRRQYFGSQIRMLADTEPPLKVHFFKLVIWLQNLALLALRRPGALSRTEMRRALAATRSAPDAAVVVNLAQKIAFNTGIQLVGQVIVLAIGLLTLRLTATYLGVGRSGSCRSSSR